MLHTKFCRNRPAASGEEYSVEAFLPIYGRGGQLDNVSQMPRTYFRSPYRRRLHIKFGFDRPRGFGEEDASNCGRTATDDDNGRTPDHGYHISSPMSLRLR